MKISQEKIDNAITQAKEMCHPRTIGMTQQDIKEINAYHQGLNNFIKILDEDDEDED